MLERCFGLNLNPAVHFSRRSRFPMSLRDVPAIILFLAAGYLITVYFLLMLAQRSFKSVKISASQETESRWQSQSLAQFSSLPTVGQDNSTLDCLTQSGGVTHPAQPLT